MTIEQKDVLEKFSKAQSATAKTRDDASDMLVFGRVDQWADDYSDYVSTSFRGQFDIIKPKRNKILAELWANPVSAIFKPDDGAEDDAAEALQGMFYRDVIQKGEEALETAQQDQVDCGFGAFRLCTRYKSKSNDVDDTLEIYPEPINEANNVVFWDPNSRNKDRSDARWCTVLVPFTESGWEQYCLDNDIDYDEHKNPGDFSSPNSSTLSTYGSRKNDIFYAAEFYYKETKKERVIIYEDPFGERKAYRKSEISKVIDELELTGFTEIGRKWKQFTTIKKSFRTAEGEVFNKLIPGEFIPVFSVYGDWRFVEGREIWTGIYHDSQDQQRINNTLMGYLADIIMQGPREKDIFYKEQIEGHEWMYQDSGADNNLPYLLQNMYSPTGELLPAGAVGRQTAPDLPNSIVGLISMMRDSVDGLTGGAFSVDQMLNNGVTEGQIRAAQGQSNQETFLYQNNFSLCMKHCARAYKSMARAIHKEPTQMTVSKPDGTELDITIMETVLDIETGKDVVLNDIGKGDFEVYVDTGPRYASLKEQSRTEMKELALQLQGTPEGQIALLTYLSMVDSPGSEDLASHAHKQLILQGIKEPQTDEEKAMLMQAQSQPPAPDPAMQLAVAEQQKAQADMLSAQTSAQTKATDNQIKAYKAETERMRVVSQNNLTNKQAEQAASEVTGNELDNVQKIAASIMPPGVSLQ